MNEVINELSLALAYLVPTVVVWLLCTKGYNLVTPFKLQQELTQKDNPAVAVSFGGFCLGVVLALMGLYHASSGASSTVQSDLIAVVGYGALSGVLMVVSSFINDKVILPSVSTAEALVDRNMAMGFVEAGSYVANGLILCGALSGEGSLVTGLVFWVISQVVLVIISVVYNMITKFDSKQEIISGNTAVGVAYAGFLVAMGNILKAGTQGSFVSWSENLTNFGIIVGFSLVVLPVVRIVLDKFVVSKASLSEELAVDKNTGVGALEAIFYVSASLLISSIMLS